MMSRNASIPEEESQSHSIDIEARYDDVEYTYTLDLGSGGSESACPTPPLGVTKRLSVVRPTPRPKPPREAERDCGICFERAVAPVRTCCCAHLFCAEHIADWLHGPASDGLCPGCCAPSSSTGLIVLGHPAFAHLVPRTPPPSRFPSPAPSLSSAPSYSSSYSSSYSPSSPSSSYSASSSLASYPSTPAPLCDSDPDPSEEEDTTDYSFTALQHARALQTRRHTPHPFSSVLGVRGALGSVVRIAGWVLVVAVLAGRGRWG